MKLSKEDLMVNTFNFTRGIFDVYCPSEDMADFLYLQGKLNENKVFHEGMPLKQ